MAGAGQKRITKVLDGTLSCHHLITDHYQELADLSKNAPVGMTVGLKEESNIHVWKVDMEGPTNTPYVVCLYQFMSRKRGLTLAPGRQIRN